ncbi:MAG TPA: NAD-glutamate dehydrogenase, partial [Lysobacter sp.]|nr:NAD-glutamate dehydrogenase [Lysobacter sp.]
MSTRQKAAASGKKATARKGAFNLAPVLDALGKRVPKSQLAESQAFAQAFYKRMSAEEFAEHGADGWAALAAGMLEFAAVRKPGKANLRLFNASLKENGWESPHTVLQIVNDDMPFLVDSVTMALAEQDIGVHVLGHPVVPMQRDKAGTLVGVGEGNPESFIHLEIDRQPQAAMAKIEKAIAAVLQDVRAAVGDWEAMRQRMLEVADTLPKNRIPVSEGGVAEAQEFLRWAADNHFTFLGYREYTVEKQGREDVLVAHPETGLGLLRGKEAGTPRLLSTLAAHYMPQSGAVDALILTKTNARATVHRPGYMDYIGVLSFDAKGKPVREQRFLGLYTSSAYNRRPWDIPLVRERYEHVMRESGLRPASHSGKALRHIMETLPRDELFQSSEAELFQAATGILGLQERVRSKLFLRPDRYGRFYSVLVYVPRDRHDTQMRHRIEDMLKQELHGEHIDSTVHIGESPLAQVH